MIHNGRTLRNAQVAAKLQFGHSPGEIRIGADEVSVFLEVGSNWEGEMVAFERIPAFKWVGRIMALGFAWLFASYDVSLHGLDEMPVSKR